MRWWTNVALGSAVAVACTPQGGPSQLDSGQGSPEDSSSVPYFVPSFEIAAGTDAVGLGRAIAVADFDDDGILDILSGTSNPATTSASTLTAHRGLGDGTFAETTAAWGLATRRAVWGLLPLDIDLDGDLDLLATRDAWTSSASNSLWTKTGATFGSERQAPTGSCGEGASMSSSAGDFDGDGDLDVVIANGAPNNQGGCVEVLAKDGNDMIPLTSLGEGCRDGFGTAVGDLDGDGLPDLLVVSARQAALVYRNRGVAPWLGLHSPTYVSGLPPDAEYALTGVLLDYDQDGDLDIAVCIWGEPAVEEPTSYQQLLRNDGDMQFTDVSEEAGVASFKGCMGIGTGDIDGNGFPDLYLGTGTPEDVLAPNVLLMNTGGAFVDVAEEAGAAWPGRTHGIVFADMDADQRTDLVSNSGGTSAPAQSGPLRVAMNRGETFPTLPVRILGAQSDRRAVGARLEVHTDVGTRYAWVDGGQGFGSVAIDRFLIGLGEATEVRDVVVVFPDGVEIRSGRLNSFTEEIRLRHP